MESQGDTRSNPDTLPPDYAPMRILEAEIGHPLLPVNAVDPDSGTRYQKGLALVRLHTQPIGMLEVRFDERGLSPEDYACQVWERLGDEVNAHLQEDGLPEVDRLTADGISGPSAPRCVAEREKVLQDAPFVSVVISTRDRAHMLTPTLESLLRLDYPNFEILVVDNAPSTDATADLIRHTYGNNDKVRYVREDRPGLGVAHNRSLNEITAPIVAFTDDDVLLDKYWLSELVSGFSAGPNVACVTGIVLPAEIEAPAQWLVEQYVGLSKGFEQRLFDMDENRDSSVLYPYSAGWFGTGASMAFKTDVLRELGGFAADLGTGTQALGGDDLDAFFRTIVSGYQLVYQPSAILWHFHRREYAGLLKMAFGYGTGLTAFLTKSIKDRPLRFFDIGVRVPLGIYYMLKARSPKVIQRSPSFPKELLIQERKGMCYGPLAYLRSYRNHRRISRGKNHLPQESGHRVDAKRVSGQQ